MERRTTISHSRRRYGNMKASIAFVLCFVVGCTFGYYVRREAPYNVGPDDPYAVEITRNFFPEPSQKLFWGNSGSNQVGGTGWWATLTNKFPFLGNMFGRMEEPSVQYGVPATHYGPPPTFQQPVFFTPQRQFLPQQLPQPFFTQFTGSRDVGLTDDAVIITPPQVPAFPQPAPVRPPAPAPAPTPEPYPGSGYTYNKPQYRLELPQK